ncbi:hypothetical protein KC660_02940 [Candidatus Dojkabacteria bacterium]|uniref:Uncharacterized protein n=1 Tax=Candidatus Dojkabacteria bacterium TaxID=2099670 RepID=A0A955L3T8_9BACT|nr:hypothetical protein [Candidatus Dojkabacteria bacterium]
MEPLTNTPEGIVFASNVGKRANELYQLVVSENTSPSYNYVHDGVRFVGYFRSKKNQRLNDFEFRLDSKDQVIGVSNGALNLDLNLSRITQMYDEADILDITAEAKDSWLRCRIAPNGNIDIVESQNNRHMSEFLRVTNKYWSDSASGMTDIPLAQVEVTSGIGFFVVNDDVAVEYLVNEDRPKFDIKGLVDFILASERINEFTLPTTNIKLTDTKIGNTGDPNQARVEIDGENYGLLRLQSESLAGEPTGWRYALISPNGQVEIVDTDLRPIAEVVEDLQTKNAQDSR